MTTKQHPHDDVAEVPAKNVKKRPRDDAPEVQGKRLKSRQWLGAALLIAVIVAVIATRMLGGTSDDEDDNGPGGLTVVNGYGGVLKYNFMHDPEIAAILAERYGLSVDIEISGSIVLLCDTPLDGQDDFIWLGDQSSVDIYRDCGGVVVGVGNVYNSPLVLYSWAPITDALVAAGVAQVDATGAYVVDFALLVSLMTDGAGWADLGLTQLHGKIKIHTTDPAKSNSGFLLAGLLANILNGGDVVDAATVTAVLPALAAIFANLGFMQDTSGGLFEQFLTTGMGAKPIVAGYESQVLEYLATHPDLRDQIADQVRILYPAPTVWASHPFVARTENGLRLLEALQDPDIQRLAWEQHGQRPGVAGVVIDPKAVPIPGILSQITSVVEKPSTDVLTRIMEAIAAPPTGTKTPLSRSSRTSSMSEGRGRRFG